MELKDTVELMNSDDWKDRFVAEYLQTKIRYKKLHKMVVKMILEKDDFDTHEFDTHVPIDIWKEQLRFMGLYLYELENRAVIQGIELPKV